MTKLSAFKVFLLSGLAIAELFLVSAAHAGAPACDPQFMTTLRQRAWREAQREIMMNESFILKPDSVFAMSCFGSALSSVPNSFTNGSPTTATSTSVSNYISANFAHGTLGTTGSQPSTSSCGQMQTIWVRAKCTNLAFNTFDQGSGFGFNITSERRINNGQTCSSGFMSTEFNNSQTRLNQIGGGTRTNAPFNIPNLFLNVTDPLSTLSGGNCTAIKTGVKVGTPTVSYDEVVCPNPGCAPSLQGGVMKCCDQNNVNAKCSP